MVPGDALRSSSWLVALPALVATKQVAPESSLFTCLCPPPHSRPVRAVQRLLLILPLAPVLTSASRRVFKIAASLHSGLLHAHGCDAVLTGQPPYHCGIFKNTVMLGILPAHFLRLKQPSHAQGCFHPNTCHLGFRTVCPRGYSITATGRLVCRAKSFHCRPASPQFQVWLGSPEFESWCCLLLAVWPWAHGGTSLSLDSPVSEHLKTSGTQLKFLKPQFTLLEMIPLRVFHLGPGSHSGYS